MAASRWRWTSIVWLTAIVATADEAALRTLAKHGLVEDKAVFVLQAEKDAIQSILQVRESFHRYEEALNRLAVIEEHHDIIRQKLVQKLDQPAKAAKPDPVVTDPVAPKAPKPKPLIARNQVPSNVNSTKTTTTTDKSGVKTITTVTRVKGGTTVSTTVVGPDGKVLSQNVSGFAGAGSIPKAVQGMIPRFGAGANPAADAVPAGGERIAGGKIVGPWKAVVPVDLTGNPKTPAWGDQWECLSDGRIAGPWKQHAAGSWHGPGELVTVTLTTEEAAQSIEALAAVGCGSQSLIDLFRLQFLVPASLDSGLADEGPKNEGEANRQARQQEVALRRKLLFEKEDVPLIAEYRRMASDDLVPARKELLERVPALQPTIADLKNKYRALSENVEVEDALAELRKKKPTAKLGPSEALAGAIEFFEPFVGRVRYERTPVRKVGSEYRVSASLNGGPAVELKVDFDAPAIVLPAEKAVDLGLQSDDTDPLVVFTTDDGRFISAKRKRIQSATIGTFVARNVDCYICPPGMEDSPCSLGKSFLAKFDCSLDANANSLIIRELLPAKPN